MELQESLKRLSVIQGLLPFLEMSAGINAEAMTSTTVADLFIKSGMEEGSDELTFLLEALHTLEAFVSYAGLVAAFSAAADLGLIKVSGNILSEVHDHE